MTHLHPARAAALISAAAALACLVVPAATGLAAPEFEPLLRTRTLQCLEALDGTIFAGTDGGGVLLWDAAGHAVTGQWTAGAEITGNDIQALAWSGRNLWVATLGSGLTRVTDPTGTPSFRQYATNLADLDVSAVTGAIIGTSERVYYGTAGSGLGLITDGLSSSIFTREQDGLISNVIHDVHFLDEVLFVATPDGISRFANNQFTDENAGLVSLVVHDLALDADGNLIAGTGAGVFRWNDGARTWSEIGVFDAPIVGVTADADRIYGVSDVSQVIEWDGSLWRTVPRPELRCSTLLAADDLWLAGTAERSTGNGFFRQGYLARRTGPDTFDTRQHAATSVFNGSGAAFGPGGEVWMTDFGGFYVSWREDGTWSHVYETPHAGNDTLTLHPGRGPLLDMTRGADGRIWAGAYAGGGLLRIDQAARRSELIDPDNSGLEGRFVLAVTAHPQGPILVMHDEQDPELVQVVVDPDDWANPGNWVTLTRDEGLGEGTRAWDALVERDDVIWFVVEEVGLVRWDVNGDAAGPDDPLTWFDKSDDRWDPPLSFFPNTTLDPRQARTLAAEGDGTIWAGGNGLVRFSYDEVARTVTTEDDLTEKRGTNDVGLVNGKVNSIARARDGLWVATQTGLNRVRVAGDALEVTAWIDLRNYLGNPDYPALYSPSVIANLPGITYNRIAVDPAGERILVAADQGVTLVAADPAGGGSGGGTVDPLAGVYCYPNPWSPGVDGGDLWIAGLPAGADGQNPVSAELYNLEGQPVWRDTHDDGGAPWSFWNGRNRFDQYVSTGLYVLRVSWNGAHTTRTVALVR
jgi:hypothetical protein